VEEEMKEEKVPLVFVVVPFQTRKLFRLKFRGVIGLRLYGRYPSEEDGWQQLPKQPAISAEELHDRKWRWTRLWRRQIRCEEAPTEALVTTQHRRRDARE
jgi:hypothetical protein